MDPISAAILAAVAAGVSGGVTAVGKEAVVDAYNCLKQGIVNRFGRGAKVVQAIAGVEAAPESKACQMVLVEEAGQAGIGQAQGLQELAGQLKDALEQTREGREAVARFHVESEGAQVGVIGNHARVEGGIHFHYHGGSDISGPKTDTAPHVRPSFQRPPEPRPHRIAARFQPGGALEAECPFYIQRQADEAVMAAVSRHRGLVTLQGPSQTGKTSMMLRLYAQARNLGSQLRPVVVDLQSLPEVCFKSLAAIWQAILSEVDAQLAPGACPKPLWRDHAAYDRNLSDYFEQSTFASDDMSVLLCLDEVNQVFGMPVRSEFFSSVRSFYNRGAYDPTWKKLRWLLTTSSEPRFFIDDLNQSPFNVGARVLLGAFSFEETAEFVRRYGFPPETRRVGRIMACLGGQPYLVHLLLHHMALQPEREAALLDAASAGDGVFKPHLDHYLGRFQDQSDLAAAMKRVIAGKGCPDVRKAERLASAGLVKEDRDGNIICACELYATYFGRRL